MAIDDSDSMQLLALETLSSVVVAVVAVLGFVYAWQRGIRSDIRDVRSDIQVLQRNMNMDMRELSDRVARIEGTLKARSETPVPSPARAPYNAPD